MMRIILCGLAISAWCCAVPLLATADEYRWIQVTSAASFAPRDGAGAVTYNGKMWLLGGWADNPVGPPHPHVGYNDVWSSTDGLNWTEVRPNTPNSPTVWDGRHCAGYVVFKNKVWIVGGDSLLRRYQPDVWSSTDGINWIQATANAPWGKRGLHITLVHDDKIWVMGGQTIPPFVPGPEIFYNDVWNSADGERWTRVTEHAGWSPRGMIQGSVVFKGRMWLLGGGTYDTPNHPTRFFYNEVWSSVDGIHWRKDAVAPWAKRQFHSVAVFDDKMWVLAGANFDTAEMNRNDVWYSSDGVNWTELPDTPWPTRHAGSVFVYGDHLWMVAGSHPGSTPINDVWRLDRNGKQALNKGAAEDPAPNRKPPGDKYGVLNGPKIRPTYAALESYDQGAMNRFDGESRP